jgi:hypothetical protein
MKLTFKSFLLSEGRAEFTAQQYKTKLLAALEKDHFDDKIKTEVDVVNYLRDHVDPTAKGLYLVWIAKMYAAGQFKLEDAARVKKDIELFDKVKSKLENKDLSSYKTMNDFYDVIEKFEDTPDAELQTNAAKKAEVKKGSEVFFDAPGLKVIIPKTEEAACLYKFQLHYETDAFMDERDQAIGAKDKAALSKIPAYGEFLNKLIKKHYTPYIEAA